jgi:uncharacterized protein YuzE
MEITIDKDADAMYIKFSNAKFAKNKKIDDETIIDIDINGQIKGIELLDVSKRISSDFLKKVKVRNIELET